MSDFCATVRIVSNDAPGGFVIINAVDKTAEHEIFVEKDESATDFSKFTAQQLRDELISKAIPFPSNAAKADLLALLVAGKVE